MTPRLALLGLLLLASALPAQPAKPKRTPAEQVADRFLAADTALVNKGFLDGATTLAQWQERLPRLRQEYLDMLGLWPLPARTPLEATITGTVRNRDVEIDRLHFQSRPGLYVTGNLYRPRGNKKKLPAILYVCGHSGKGLDGNKTAFQDHGTWFARNGYVCLIVDTLQLGEIAGKHHGTYNLGRWWWHSLAYTPAGVECWNGMRAIDYLVGRPDVDADRIGVTGISGGGATTVWIAAADDRVKVAVPVSGMSDLESYVTNKVVDGHCDCMFVVNLYRWEWTTLAALIAPRPMLFANSDDDRIFPMDGNRRIMARLREVYKMHGKPDLVNEHVSVGGHDYRPDLRLAIFRWFNKHLKKDDGAIEDARNEPLPGKDLRVFAKPSDFPKDALNARIDESFITRAKITLPHAKGFPAWRKQLLERLRAGPFRNLGPIQAATDPGACVIEGNRAIRRIRTEHGSESHLDTPALPFRPIDLRTLIVEGTEPLAVADLDRAGLKRDVNVSRLRPRGIGETAWGRKNPPNNVERSYALLGLTVDLGRVRDILATMKLLNPGGKESWRLVGRGESGILAAYAALFDSNVSEVVVIDPPASHLEGPHFLGVLRVLDVPEALGLLAPRKLTLIGARERAFDRTAEIYHLAGAASKLTRPVPRSRIDPAGYPGAMMLASEASPQALKQFVELAGGSKATIGIVTTNDHEDRLVEKMKPAQARIWKVGTGPGKVDPSGITGVWFAGSATLLDQTQLARDWVLGTAGKWVPNLARRLPDAAVVVRTGAGDADVLTGMLARDPYQVGYEIGPGASLLVRGRRVLALGTGTVTVHLAAGGGRPARRTTLASRQLEDLTALRRATRDRAEGFPPATVREPVVEKGSLVIAGGGKVPAGLVKRFVDLAGGKEARIVILPTGLSRNLPDRVRNPLAEAFRKAGAKVTILSGASLAQVESKQYRDVMKEATGLWFGGGRQWHFVDAYEQTSLLPLMHQVLARGGVIGGGSAGATIQGDYLCRGGVFDNFAISSEGYERGFAFLPGVAIDQHFAQRKRFKDMTALMKRHPRYLGIGIDETTVLIVQGSRAEVFGAGKVHFYDRRSPIEPGKPDHVSLVNGECYDLKDRKMLSPKEPTR